ncbi:MAG: histidine phosphatase family protein, partial [Chloroflexi bacterium]|nr:histidine phosphatase family protein [Chloroflexota bacterium]
MLLIRHGETEWNKLGRFQGQNDIALNPRGLAQAKETAQALEIG